jgi:hypothetical protein
MAPGCVVAPNNATQQPWYQPMVDKWGADTIRNALPKNVWDSQIAKNQRYQAIHGDAAKLLPANATTKDMHAFVRNALGVTPAQYSKMKRGSVSMNGTVTVPPYVPDKNPQTDVVSFLVNAVTDAHENGVHAQLRSSLEAYYGGQNAQYYNAVSGPGSGPMWANDEVKAYQSNIDMITAFRDFLFPPAP